MFINWWLANMICRKVKEIFAQMRRNSMEKEILKKCHQCMDIIVHAKDRQAAEANKNASFLLEQLERERTQEESKRAAAARKREKKRQKKKEKQEREKEEASKNSSPEPDENDMGEIKVDEADLIEQSDIIPVEDDKSSVVISAPAQEPPLQNENKNLNNKKNAENENANSRETKSKNKKNKRQKERAPVEIPLSAPPSSTPYTTSSMASTTISNRNSSSGNHTVVVSSTKTVTTTTTTASSASNSNNTTTNTTKSSSNKANKENRKKAATVKNTNKNISTTGIGDLDDFGIPPNIPDLPLFPTKKEKSKNVPNRVSSLDTFESPLKLTPVKSAVSNNPSLRSPAVTPSPKKGQKREEGWKEVVRKSKKVTVPATAISRVIGRSGCNINAIREVSGAHIEIDKQQKGTTDRTITIRGSADATRQAHNLITALIKDPDKDLGEIMPKTKSKSPLMTIDTFVPPTTTAAPTSTPMSNGPSEHANSVAYPKMSPPVVSQATVPAWGNVPQQPLQQQQLLNSATFTTSVSPSKSPTKVSRQLFPMTAGPGLGPVAKPTVSVTSASNTQYLTNTVFTTMSNSISMSSMQKPQPPQPIGPPGGRAPIAQDNPLSNPMIPMPFQNPSNLEYSHFMRGMPAVFPGKMEDDARMNFAAPPSGVGSASSMAPNTNTSAADVSRVPGFPLNGHLSGPHSMEDGWARAPGANGPLRISAGQEYEQQQQLALMNSMPGPAGSSMTSPVFITNSSPRSSTSTPSHISPRGMSLARDQYTKADQPMTLPTIESTLNPNAPDFMSRSSGFQFGSAHPMNQSRFPNPAQFGGIPNQAQPSAFSPAQPGLIGRPRFPPQPGIPGFPLRSQMPSSDGFPVGLYHSQAPQLVPRPGVSPVPPGATVLSSLPGSSHKPDNVSPRIPGPPAASPAPNTKTPSPTDQSYYSALEERLFPRPIGTERTIKKPAVPGLGDLGIWSFNAEGSTEWSGSSMMSSVTPPPRTHTPEDRPSSRPLMGPTFLENHDGSNVDNIYQGGGLSYQGFSNGPTSLMAGMSGDSMWSPQVSASDDPKKWNWNQSTTLN